MNLLVRTVPENQTINKSQTEIKAQTKLLLAHLVAKSNIRYPQRFFAVSMKFCSENTESAVCLDNDHEASPDNDDLVGSRCAITLLAGLQIYRSTVNTWALLVLASSFNGHAQLYY